MPQSTPSKCQETPLFMSLPDLSINSCSSLSDTFLVHESVVLKLECASESLGTLGAAQATATHKLSEVVGELENFHF